MGRDAPFARDILLQRFINAFKHTGDADFRVRRDIDFTQLLNRLFPHLRPDLFQPQNDVEKASMLQTERTRGRAQRTEIEKTAKPLILLREYRWRIVAFITAREIG